MAVDHLLFTSALNERREGFSDPFLEMIGRACPGRLVRGVELQIADLVEPAQDKLLCALEATPAWNRLWFREFRAAPLLHMLATAATWLSSGQSVRIAKRWNQALDHGLAEMRADDRLHLVCHGWGAVVLLDLLFAPRWRRQRDAQALRERFFGCQSDRGCGHPLSSMVTMGTPMHFFALLDRQFVGGRRDRMHDIGPALHAHLERLYHYRGHSLPWLNLLHPADLLAAPIEGLLHAVGPQGQGLVEAHDIVLPANPLDHFGSLLAGGLDMMPRDAHGGSSQTRYWASEYAAEAVARAIVRGSTPSELRSA